MIREPSLLRAPGPRLRARLVRLIALLVLLAPGVARAQEPHPPAPDAVPLTYLPAIQSSPPFNAAACVCTQSMAGLDGQIVPNQYIVVMAEGAARSAGGDQPTAAFAADVVTASGGTLLHLYETALDGFAAVLPPAAVDALRADPRVALVEPDRYVVLDLPENSAGAGSAGISAEALGAPEEGVFPSEALAIEWGLDRIDQRTLPLNGGFGPIGNGAGVHLYVLDSGLRASHSEFTGRVGVGATFIRDGQLANDCHGHGTHTAATAAGATFGVARRAIIHPVRVLDRCGSGLNSGVIAGINWVTRNALKPAVVNMSLGSDTRTTAVDQAVRASIRSGVTYVVAAGNDGLPACSFTPARVGEAITVGASSRRDGMAGFSNWGACLDLFAPGVAIRSAWHTGDGATQVLNGTSMAAPHVAGAVALFLSRTPAASPAQVAAALRSSSTVGRLSLVGVGTPNRLLYIGTAGQSSSACTDVLRNGSFTQSGERWSQSSSSGFALVCTQSSCGATIAPRSAPYMGWLGGGNNERALLRQSVDLPAGRNAILSFWYRISSSDICGPDRGFVAVDQGATTLDAWSFALCRASVTAGWQYAELSVPEGAGQRVDVVAGAQTDGSAVSSFYIDDLRLIVGDGCVLAAGDPPADLPDDGDAPVMRP